MRDIKFRGLGVDGEWWYGESSPTKEFRHVNLATFFTNVHGGAIRPKTIGEWTGLKDNKGTEIYEGDIVKCNGGAEDFFSEVGFEHGCFIAKMPWVKGKHSYPELKYYIDMKFVSTEVIGNIWESPELLEVK